MGECLYKLWHIHKISFRKKKKKRSKQLIHINMDESPGIKLNKKCKCLKITYYMIHFWNYKIEMGNKLCLGEGQAEKSRLVSASMAIKVQEIVLVIKLFHTWLYQYQDPVCNIRT